MRARPHSGSVSAMAAGDIRVDARTAALLCRLGLAELARWALENADVRDRVHHRPRRSRRELALKVGAVALGFAVAGVAVRRAQRDEPLPPPAA
jgi:hypothetical protein